MPLGTDYAGQDCSLAKALEIVGERWSLLLVRDAFLGVTRFSDFSRRLGISKAVLTQRLGSLVVAGVLERHAHEGHDAYALTPSGEALWPAVHALMRWGDDETSPRGPRRLFRHVTCDADLDASGRCPVCGATPPARELETRPGPGARTDPPTHPLSALLRSPHRLLTPLRDTPPRDGS
ncbi:winged helix-turn-helix transcriptional regulator [Terrabacter sp. 2RAF25]|uniref:winged helix-turn-helix transcriptional regulator n=1 Tax=Terrabacter sp. 2RAF25 TaxID=3232998 RepID=UPI003F96ECC4